MRQVTRTKKPSSLARNEHIWTNGLMTQVQAGMAFKDIPDSIKNKYRQKDVQEALKRMYDKKCCYCEHRIGVTDYEHIDHLRPKADRRFHHLAFAWTNLHWSCQRCNQRKKDQWEDVNPILDPTIDDPEQHFEFDFRTCKILSKSPRGDTTIDHTGLNREDLVEARKKLKDSLRRIIRHYKTHPQDRSFYNEFLEPYLQQKSDISHTLFIRLYLRRNGLRM